MSGDVLPFLNLVTSEHQPRPKFIAALTAIMQPLADQIAVANSLPAAFDIDTAIGVQLEAVGEWVGHGRIAGAFTLDDATYRRLLKAIVIANHWHGDYPTAYLAWDQLWSGQDYTTLIQDNGDMSMSLAIYGAIPDALTLELFTGGHLHLKPAGVRIAAYFYPTVADTPFFGFDVQNSHIAGFDTGAWANIA